MNEFELSAMPYGAHIHFTGIGGISMSGLAEIMQNRGFHVTGSDVSDTHITRHLQSLGIQVFNGHDAGNPLGADLCVYTAAIAADNAELVTCEAEGIPAVERAVLLGALMKSYACPICVAGTHGKTTTTSMLSAIMLGAKLDPTIMLGGELDLIDGNFCIGNGDYFLTEACEYHCSFLEFFPKIALITNIEADHLDYFTDLDHIIDTFSKFVRLLPPDGSLIVYGEDKNAMYAAKDASCKVYTYGLEKGNDFYPENLTYEEGYPTFDIVCPNGKRQKVSLNVAGEHNVKNALAAFSAGYAMELDGPDIAMGLALFEGVKRRFEKKGELNGAQIYDDYAHHPTEVMATLKMAKELTHHRVIVAFQPHTYSRTRLLLDDFSTAFDLADKIIITDIYAAREKNDGSIHAKDLAELIAARGKDVTYMGPVDEIPPAVKMLLQPGDLFISMGAGSIYKVSDALAKTDHSA